ncbi:TRAP transporter substrate-binding protein [Ancylobacter dichloromethanicus]|uniref:C4-dicarboxylate ABC transporter substrate-binding protein n=1 Tax=Ancylobacter dichloromethanicus TaxID=518825 RepID=A0A9W6N0D2_9HYPH|nr:TRAP transporter substrate-binding protein [Ancylobacter dichloromethanicus]MBS7553178.1 TRAP transporter substrate-binding protein [Ancylobacter dichloromethanicus]GLK72955.1 C4-dicarboxylate ABC transporter substrate-binding protein [Ancylobacter dichloromethanicus]
MNRIIALTAAALLGFAAPAAATTVIKAGHGTHTTHPTHLALVKLAEIVDAKSHGEMKIEIYPDRQLGEEREMVEGLQLGTVDMAVVSTGPLVAFVPELGVVDLPFLFKNSQHAYKVFDSEIGQGLLAKFETRGIVGLAWWENGWRSLTSKKVVKSPADLKGMKLRTMQNPVHIAAFKELGAAPIPMVWGEVFTSLSQGVIDAQENPVTIIYSNSLWEVQKYLTLTRHVYGPHVALFSKIAWDRLTPDQQKILTEAMIEATAYQRETSARLETEQLKLLADKGMIIEDVDIVPFQEATAGTAAAFKNIDPAVVAKIKAAAN